MNWQNFWDTDPPIYVNLRHKQRHYQRLAKDCGRYILSDDARVLDYGCGVALSADLLAKKCQTLYLYDLSPTVQAALNKQFPQPSNIVILDDKALENLPLQQLDLVLVNSLLHYVTIDEFERLLILWNQWLKPGGHLLLADILPPDLTIWQDAGALLHFARQQDFYISALFGLVRTFFSPYCQLRRQHGLTRYSPSKISNMLENNGFSGKRQALNIGFNQARFTFYAQKQ